MARVGYCRHNVYVGHPYLPCSQCEQEARNIRARQVAVKEKLHEEIREVLAEDLRKEAVGEMGRRFDSEALGQVVHAFLGNYEAQVVRDRDGRYGLFTLAGTFYHARPFMNLKDGKSPYSWASLDEAVSDWYIHFGAGKLSPDYGLFHEFREDGWPLCPKCGEDELSSRLVWPNLEKPSMIAFVHAGMTCLKCGFEVEEEDWKS